MTGTSADSIDGCVVDFSNGFELIHSKSNNLEKNYKSKYEEAIKKGFKKRNDDKMVLKLEESLNKSSVELIKDCLLYTSPSPRDRQKSRMPSSA